MPSLVACGAYDLSSLATLRGWSLRLCLVDMAWGAAASAFAGGLACLIGVLASARGG